MFQTAQYSQLQLINHTTDGVIPQLLAGETVPVNTTPEIGFGKIHITVYAIEPHYYSSDTKQVDGFLFGFWIIIP